MFSSERDGEITDANDDDWRVLFYHTWILAIKIIMILRIHFHFQQINYHFASLFLCKLYWHRGKLDELNKIYNVQDQTDEKESEERKTHKIINTERICRESALCRLLSSCLLSAVLLYIGLYSQLAFWSSWATSSTTFVDRELSITPWNVDKNGKNMPSKKLWN